MPTRLLFIVSILVSLSISSYCYAADGEQSSSENSSSESEGEEQSSSQQEAVLPEPIIYDVNGNGTVEIIAFGDSITRGVGDFIGPSDEVEEALTPAGEAGYPLRIELLLGIPVSNWGGPGERMTHMVNRFAETIPSATSDFVIISGGTNDAFWLIPPAEVMRAAQTMINIAKAVGMVPMLATAPPTCCMRSELYAHVAGYNEEYRRLAAVNEIELMDVEKAYLNTCNVSRCYLLNRPEGLHPNSEGYDVSGEVIIAKLLNIDIFAPDGPALLEQALDLPPGAVQTEPDPAPPEAAVSRVRE